MKIRYHGTHTVISFYGWGSVSTQSTSYTRRMFFFIPDSDGRLSLRCSSSRSHTYIPAWIIRIFTNAPRRGEDGALQAAAQAQPADVATSVRTSVWCNNVPHVRCEEHSHSGATSHCTGIAVNAVRGNGKSEHLAQSRRVVKRMLNRRWSL